MSGVSTKDKQDELKAVLQSIDTKTVAVSVGQKPMATSAPVVVASDQTAIPVSATALPLPAGAATEAKQTAANADILATRTNTGNIDNKTPALGQAAMAASVPVTLASDQGTTGSVIDSAAVAQNTKWRNVADGGATADANLGVIPFASIVTGTVVKLYQLPLNKEFHEIMVTQQDSAGVAFEYTLMVLAANEMPSAAWALNDYMSVGGLVVPSYKVSRDRTKTLVAQPLIRTHATYLVFIVDVATVQPGNNPRIRVLSYNERDLRV